MALDDSPNVVEVAMRTKVEHIDGRVQPPGNRAIDREDTHYWATTGIKAAIEIAGPSRLPKAFDKLPAD